MCFNTSNYETRVIHSQIFFSLFTEDASYLLC